MGYVKLVFFMLYTILCQLVFSSSLSHLCPEDQALALLQFKHMFTINPNASDDCRDIITYQEIQSYPRTLLWNKSTDCCSWDGVHCDEMTGQVIELDLSCSKLQGSSFTGLIPTEISHLSKLHILRISGLNDLSLGPHNFEHLLKNLTQLRELYLDYVDIFSTIPLNFSPYLTNIRLPYTQLRGVLPERVFHLSDLEFLHLSNNFQRTVRFPTAKWNSSASLMKLYLCGLNITSSIPESFSHLTSLLELDMAYSNLSGSYPKPLLNLTNLESLFLGHNHLEGPISQFSRFGQLKELALRNNNFNGGLDCLSFNRSWMQLEFLDFSSNSLTGPIPSNVTGLQNLQWLLLSLNHLNGTIPSWIFSLPSRGWGSRKVEGGNHFSGSEVDLRQNQLQGPLPNSLLNQPNLAFLLLSHNNISGQIASPICNLKTLVALDLGSTNFFLDF